MKHLEQAIISKVVHGCNHFASVLSISLTYNFVIYKFTNDEMGHSK